MHNLIINANDDVEIRYIIDEYLSCHLKSSFKSNESGCAVAVPTRNYYFKQYLMQLYGKVNKKNFFTTGDALPAPVKFCNIAVKTVVCSLSTLPI